jgi:hypothetical protein
MGGFGPPSFTPMFARFRSAALEEAERQEGFPARCGGAGDRACRTAVAVEVAKPVTALPRAGGTTDPVEHRGAAGRCTAPAAAVLYATPYGVHNGDGGQRYARFRPSERRGGINDQRVRLAGRTGWVFRLGAERQVRASPRQARGKPLTSRPDTPSGSRTTGHGTRDTGEAPGSGTGTRRPHPRSPRRRTIVTPRTPSDPYAVGPVRRRTRTPSAVAVRAACRARAPPGTPPPPVTPKYEIRHGRADSPTAPPSGRGARGEGRGHATRARSRRLAFHGPLVVGGGGEVPAA